MYTPLPKNLISTKEASSLSGYNADYLSRLCREGKITGMQVGRAWLVQRESLETFMAAQIERKVELAEQLAKERELEYQKANLVETPVARMTGRMEQGTREVANSIISAFARVRMPRARAPFLVGRAAALGLTAAILSVATVLAGTGVVAHTGELFLASAFDARASAIALVSDSQAYAVARQERMLARTDGDVTRTRAVIASMSETRIAALPGEAHAAIATTPHPLVIADTGYAHADESSAALPRAYTFAETSALAASAVEHPDRTAVAVARSLASAYESIGTYALRDIDTALSMHARTSEAGGEALLASAVAARDLPHEFMRVQLAFGMTIVRAVDAILAAYESGVYAYATHVEDAPRAIVNGVHSIGTLVAGVVETGVLSLPHAYDAGMLAFAERSAGAGTRISSGSYAFGTAARGTVSGALQAQDRAIAQGVAESRLVLLSARDTVSAAVTIIPAVAIDQALGVAGNLALSLESADTATLPANPLAALDLDRFLPDFLTDTRAMLARAVYGALHGIFGPTAGFFEATGSSGLAIIPLDDVLIPRPAGSVMQGSAEGNGIAYGGPVTVINNEYPSVTYTGVTQSYVDAQIDRLRYILERSVENARERPSGGGGIASIDGLTGDNVTLNDPTINGGTITGSELDVATTTITGTLTVNGDVNVNGNVSLNSTSTNFYATNATLDNATSTNFFSTVATVVDAFFTNLSAASANITNAVIATLTATDATFTNATSTNAVVGNVTATSSLSLGYATPSRLLFVNGAGVATSTDLSSWIAGTANQLTVTDNALGGVTLSLPSTIVIGSSEPTTITSDGGMSIFGGDVRAGIIEAVDYIAGPYVLATSTTATSAFSGNIAVGRNATLGTTAADLLTVNSSIASSLVPSLNNTHDIGAPGYFWRTGYFDHLIINSLEVGSTTIAGTDSSDFTINTDNVSNDAESMSLIFFRGIATPNAVLAWNSVSKRFEFNMAIFSDNGIFTNATTTNLVATNFTLGGSPFTSLLGSGLSNTGGVLTLDRTGDWTGLFDGQEGGYYLARANHTGTQLSSTISDFATSSRNLFSSTATGLTYTTSTGVSSLTPGYEIPLTASTTNWNTFYDTPSSRITAGTGLNWSGNTLNVSTSSLALDTLFYQLGGNTFGTTAVLGTNDAQSLALETAGITRLSIDTNGVVDIDGSIQIADLDLNVNIGDGNILLNAPLTSVALGTANTLDLSSYGSAVGYGNTVSADFRGSAFGYGNTAGGADSSAFGYLNVVSADGASAFGSGITNSIASSTMIGPSNTAKMTILSNGNVGIGSTAPVARLDVLQSADNADVFRSYRNANQYFGIQHDSSKNMIASYNSTSSPKVFVFNQTTDSSNTAPASFANLTYQFRILNANKFIITNDASNVLTDLTVGTNKFVIASTSPANSFVLNSAGNVGIGSSTPSAKLTVIGGGITTGRAFSVSDSAGSEKFSILDNGTVALNGALGSWTMNNTSNNLVLNTSSSFARYVNITNTGAGSANLYVQNNVGIGTSTPIYALDIAAGTGIVGRFSGRVIGADAMNSNEFLTLGQLSTATSSLSSLYFAQNGNSFATTAVLGTNDANDLQFETNGTTKMTILSNGSVGIGTTTPNTKLTVTTTGANGINLDVNTVDTNNSGRLFLTNNTTGYAIYNHSSVLEFAYGATAGVSSGTPGFVMNSSGSVGIGTTSPSAKLAITGTPGTDDVFTVASSTNASLLTVTSTGRIGIGTRTPSAVLDIMTSPAGNTALAVLLGTDSTASGARTNGVNKAARVGMVPYLSGTETNFTVINPVATTGNNLIGFGGGTGALAAATNLVFYTASTTNVLTGTERMRINQDGDIGIGTTSPSAKLAITGTAGTGNIFAVASSTNARLFTITSDGNVGIGDVAPIAALDIRGTSASLSATIRITGASVGALLLGQDADGGVIRGQGGAGNGLKFLVGGLGTTAAATGGTEALRITSSGNVGIGTSTPSSATRLSVYNTSSGIAGVFQGSSGAAAAVALGSYLGAGLVQGYTNDALGTTDDLALNPLGGNVGIGTTTPSATLTVAGSLNVGASGAAAPSIFVDGGGRIAFGTTTIANGQIRYQTSAGSNIFSIHRPAATGTNYALVRFSTGNSGKFQIGMDGDLDGGTDRFSIYDYGASAFSFVAYNGNIGIGSTTPSARLSVTGAGSTTGINFQTTNSSNTPLVTMLDNGNVGINTTTPGAALDVANGAITLLLGANSGSTTRTPNSVKLARVGSVSYDGGATPVGMLTAFNPGTTNQLSLGGGSSSMYSTNLLTFYTAVGTTTLLGTERMRIDSVGNVGIGTATPGGILEVFKSAGGADATGGGIILSRGNTGGTTYRGGAIYSRYISAAGADALVFGVTGADSKNPLTDFDQARMVITHTGNVGIGTSNPGSKLDVAGFVNVDVASGYKQGGTTILYASTTLFSLLVGPSAGNTTFTGTQNTAVGMSTFTGLTSGVGNTALGYNAGLGITTGSHNTALGVSALQGVTTGGSNIGIGLQAMGNGPVTGSRNISIGISSSVALTSGTDNISLGYSAGYMLSTGSSNITIGTFINSGPLSNITTGSNNIMIGNNISAPSATGNDQLNIGNIIFGTNVSGTGTTVSSANIGIGTTTPATKLDVNGTGNFNNTLYFNGTGSGSMGMLSWAGGSFLMRAQSGNGLLFQTNGANNRMSIDTAGAVSINNLVSCGGIQTNGSGTMSCTSDERLKDVQGEFSSGLAALRGITPTTYTWKANSGMYDGGVSYSGFIAQNVGANIPEAMNEGANGYKQINTTTILAASVNAIKELDLRTLSLAPAETNTEAKNLEVSADASVAGTLTVSGTGSFASVTTPGSITASSFLTTSADTLPTDVLTDGSADLFKMATYAITGLSAITLRMDDFATALESIDARLAAIEAGAATPQAPLFSFDLVKDALASLGLMFEGGKVMADRLVANTLMVGSEDHPTGVTFFDEETGDPYCLSIRDGKQRIEPGECEVGDLTQAPPVTNPIPNPLPPVFPDPGAGDQTGGTGTSTPPQQPAGPTDTTAPVVSLNGSAAEEIEANGTWSDPGASATDDTDGDISGSIQTSGSVNAAVPGSYTIEYRATDAAGNPGSASRMVIVKAAPEPVAVVPVPEVGS